MVSGAASLAVRDLIFGEPCPARVLVAGPHAAYLRVVGTARVVAVVGHGGVALPNAVVTSATPLAAIAPWQAASVGGGRILLGGAAIRVDRWWDPVPRLSRTDLDAFTARLAEVRRLLPAWPHDAGGRVGGALREQAARLMDAAVGARASAAADAAAALIGLGPGFTPSGDDVVAGFLAGVRLLPEAVTATAPALTTLVEHAAAAVARVCHRTSTPSAALLAHAARGEVARPAADLLTALAGVGALDRAVARLLAVGHTSGLDLGMGMVIAGYSISGINSLARGSYSQGPLRTSPSSCGIHR